MVPNQSRRVAGLQVSFNANEQRTAGHLPIVTGLAANETALRFDATKAAKARAFRKLIIILGFGVTAVQAEIEAIPDRNRNINWGIFEAASSARRTKDK